MYQDSSDELFNLLKYYINEIYIDLKSKIESNTNLIETINQNIITISNSMVINKNKSQEIQNHNTTKYNNPNFEYE